MVDPIILDGGNIRLYNADCLDILPTLAPGSVDAVVTDPPYGVNLTKKTSRYNKRHQAKPYEDGKDIIDTVVLPTIAITRRISARTVLTAGVMTLMKYPQPDSIGTVFSPGAGGTGSWGFGGHTPILYYGKCPYTAARLGSRPNSFSSNAANPYGADEKNIDHPCPKPLVWMLWLVQRASLEGMCVADPFMGSGTTGVACVRTGRKFIGIELDPGYFQIAVDRIQKELDHRIIPIDQVDKPKDGKAGFF